MIAPGRRERENGNEPRFDRTCSVRRVVGYEPLRNRVRPDGELVAVAARGLLMGNRGGRIHDPATRQLTGRRWTSRAWICCLLEFRGRRRQVWGDGYTELFFLDEVTALAAGHRPCFECRRNDALAFAEAVARGTGAPARLRAPELDRLLHAERLDGRAKRVHRRRLAELPDGAMIISGSDFLALRDGRLLRWTPGGYEDARSLPAGAGGTVDVLTPPTILAAFSAGYRPAWHSV